MEHPTGTETLKDEDIQKSEQERPTQTATIHENTAPEVGSVTEDDHNLELADLELQKLEQERSTDSTTVMVHEDVEPEVGSVIEADHVLELGDLEAKKPAAGQGSSIESDNLGNQLTLRENALATMQKHKKV